MNKCLIFTDGKAGHENQSRAFARALGLEFDLVRVDFRSKLHKALSYAFSWLGIRDGRLFHSLPDASGYSVVIGTGSGTFYAVEAAAWKAGVPSGVVLYPRGYRISDFDCILAPTFDRPARRNNVIGIAANLVANDESFYDSGVKAFRDRYEPKGSRAVGVIIGGPNKCSTMTAEWIRGELDRVFAENAGCEFWVTTSRRTPTEVEKAVKSYPWNYALIYSEDHFNPIPAFVKLASRLYVTAESTGMLSEACTFGNAEVFALDNLVPGRHKFRRFLDGLKECGYVGGSRKIDLSEQFGAALKLLNLKL